MDTKEPTNQTMTLQDGRRLGFAEYGNTSEFTVFHFNGSGGSRLEHPDPSLLADLKIKLITTDRPGHGISDPQPGRQLLDWPGDISQLADYLKIKHFYLIGWSAGGPHALACAYQVPERVVTGALISGLAPPERPDPYKGLPLPNRTLMTLGRRFPRLVYTFRKQVYNMLQGDTEKVKNRLASSFPPEDQKALIDSRSEDDLIANIREGYRQGWQGPAQDDILINSPWGFHLENIQTKFYIWQGEVDKNVPLNQGEYQHKLLPNSELIVLPGEAHLYLLTHWRQVLKMLIS